ncbi:MAG: protein Tex [Clostridiales bacterium]|jgi:uncharacterized protein|nr:protein Tex [Clostridiales bacterium]
MTQTAPYDEAAAQTARRIAAQISRELNLRMGQVEATIDLIDSGNTIPFIARYRKEATGGISDEVLRNFDDRLTYLRNLENRKSEVIKIIEEQGKLTEDLKRDIESAEVLQRVEDLYRPFKAKKSTRASKAIERGLEPLADLIWMQLPTQKPLEEMAQSYIDPEKELDGVEAVFAGAMDIIAERISDDPEHREMIRKIDRAKAVLTAAAADPEQQSVYEMYYEYSEPISKIANHRILAVNRGEKEKVLKVKLMTPDEEISERLEKAIVKNEKAPGVSYLKAAIADAYKRLIAPSVERELRNELTERAEEEAIQVFGKNTKALLLVPPVKDQRVLAIDPGYRTGCKVAVLDETGKMLEYATIYPHPPQSKTDAAKKTLRTMIEKHGVALVSIGNGTASRETETLVSELLPTLDRKVYYTIVSEAGASVYSASKLATEEYPDIDVSIRGAISIGRRLQDPLAELVKIDPKSIGVGQYQHDVNQKRLSEQLDHVVEDCVNSVGVDLNTATPSLLEHVAGITPTLAKNIVTYRDDNGKFKTRKELLKVKRLGDKVFEQCAGFLRIAGGTVPLDNTAVHPETYGVTNALLERLGYKKADLKKGALPDIDERLKTEGGLKAIAKTLEVGEPTLRDIVSELKKPGRDPRDEMPKPIFRNDVLKMEDLEIGMIFPGTVRNVVDFGAFVDIGVKQDGLVHISEICNRFIKHPMEVLSVGDAVTVKVIKLDKERGKIGLTMKDVES